MYRVISRKSNLDVAGLHVLRRFFCNVTIPEVSASNRYIHSNSTDKMKVFVGVRMCFVALLTRTELKGRCASGMLSKAEIVVVKDAWQLGSYILQEYKGENQSENGIQEYDIAIVGGGMVGMALACSLASSVLTRKLSVAIIDDNPALTSGSGINKMERPDPRVSTITPAAISFLENIGAWKYVEQQRHAYFDKMQVKFALFSFPVVCMDYTGLGYTRYNARDVNKEVLGCVVENKVLLSSLSLCMQIGFNGYTVKYVVHQDGQSIRKLELADGTNVAAKLVVGADGGRSRVRELAGFRSTGRKYPQNAIICTVEHSISNHCAWQRFLPAGPIALLPIGENFSNIVWTMSPKESSDRKAMNDEDFVKAVNHALDYGYGPHPQSKSSIDKLFSSFTSDVVSSNESFEVPPNAVKLASDRMVFPLSLVHTDTYAKSRVVLIGDAAHTVHPLAGQGVNLGFGDASALSKVISEGTAVGIDIGQVPSPRISLFV
ncbi:Ubiquinone biosynthesis monooxygenase COQ6 mitochondrial [Bienertia sinuspersici]